MYEIRQAIKGIKNACQYLNYPVVSGNVSLYNETNGKSIMPTPVIGGVGLIEDLNYIKGLKATEGADVFLIGGTSGHLELSVLYQVNNIKNGSPPKINLKNELRNGNFVSKMIRKTDGIIGCHDISEGGLGLALAELCIFNKIGIKINIPKKFTQTPEKWIFGEDQSRYLLIVKKKNSIEKFAAKDKIKIKKIGKVFGNSLDFINHFEISVKKLISINNKWFNNFLK
jgi:phosphoribosylformylglycinamidine synthase